VPATPQFTCFTGTKVQILTLNVYTSDAPAGSADASACACNASVYLPYWYKSTNTDAECVHIRRACGERLCLQRLSLLALLTLNMYTSDAPAGSADASACACNAGATGPNGQYVYFCTSKASNMRRCVCNAGATGPTGELLPVFFCLFFFAAFFSRALGELLHFFQEHA
jgi:hypothetical protein